MLFLGRLLQGGGKSDEARELYEQAVTIFANVLGEDHGETTTARNNIAMLYGIGGTDKADSSSRILSDLEA